MSCGTGAAPVIQHRNGTCNTAQERYLQYCTGTHRQYGTGTHLQYGTGTHLQNGTGTHLQYDTGTHQQYGTETHLQYGTGTHLQYDTGTHQQYGTETHLQYGIYIIPRIRQQQFIQNVKLRKQFDTTGHPKFFIFITEQKEQVPLSINPDTQARVWPHSNNARVWPHSNNA